MSTVIETLAWITDDEAEFWTVEISDEKRICVCVFFLFDHFRVHHHE